MYFKVMIMLAKNRRWFAIVAISSKCMGQKSTADVNSKILTNRKKAKLFKRKNGNWSQYAE